MTQMKTAWRRAVHTETERSCPTLAGLLAQIGPDAEASAWDCDNLDCVGPLAADLQREAVAGPIAGDRFVELAAGIDRVHDGIFEATRPGDDRPWLALRAADGDRFIVATRSRGLLDQMRRQFQGASVKEC